MTKKYLKFSLSILFATIFLSGCQILSLKNRVGENYEHTEEKKQVIEKEGIIAPKQVSLFEEGTHVLTDQNGEVLYILKSKVEDLKKYENKTVLIKGELNKNLETEKDDIIDVLTIGIINENTTEDESRSKIFEINDAGVRIVLTEEWLYKKEDDIWNFFTENVEKSPIKMEIFSSTSESGQVAITEMEEGTEITVAGERAFRVLNGNKINVFIIKNGNILLFKFDPQEDEISEKLIFLDLLTNLEWLEGEVENITKKDPTIDCGGEENSLCPVGYRCELESTNENSKGTCVAVDEAPEPKKECPHKTKACPDGTILEVNLETCTFAECPQAPITKEEEPVSTNNSQASSTETPNPEPETTTEEPEEARSSHETVEMEVIIDNSDTEEENTTENNNPEEENENENKEDREIRAPGETYSTIENKHFSFNVDYPVNYYWRHFGATGESVSFMGFSDIEMETIEDAVILVEIRKGAIADTSETARGEDAIILVPRDEETHFRVIGNKEYKANLWKIAQSIEIIDENVQE